MDYILELSSKLLHFYLLKLILLTHNRKRNFNDIEVCIFILDKGSSGYRLARLDKVSVFGI